MQKQNLYDRLAGNPQLEKVLAAQLIAMGYIVKQGIPLYQQIDDIDEKFIGAMIDGVKATPRAAVGLIGGAFNLVEDTVVGVLNLVPNYPPIESYGQYCRRTKREKEKHIRLKSRYKPARKRR